MKKIIMGRDVSVISAGDILLGKRISNTKVSV
jgi:hypothetical protein